MTDDRKDGSKAWLALIPAALLGSYAVSGSGGTLWTILAVAVCSGVFIGVRSRLSRRHEARATAARRASDRSDGSHPAAGSAIPFPIAADNGSAGADSGKRRDASASWEGRADARPSDSGGGGSDGNGGGGGD